MKNRATIWANACNEQIMTGNRRRSPINSRLCILCVCLFAFCVGCAAQKSSLQEPVLFAPLEVFKLGPEGGVDLVWSAKGISDAETLRTVLQKYDNLVLDQTWVVVDSESSTLLDDRQILEISRLMVREIKARLGHGYKLVETPDENTLCLSLALTTHETLQPFLGMASCLLPAASNMPTVSRIVSNQQTDAGGVTVELLVSDARTREPLIAAVDKHFSDKGIVSMITAPGGANDAISLWADRLMTTLRDWNWIKTR